MTSRTVDTTQELAAFLRTRRERLDPRDFGLPTRRQARRTPGLRREEVAELAGVSIDYVVRLEQGRGLRPSANVVEALARALRLVPDERAYLFNLAGRRPPEAGRPATAAAPPLAGLVADLSPLPAMLMNHRYDILAWNSEMARLLLDFDTLPPVQRNSMWLCLVHPKTRAFYADRERVVREGIAHLRAAWAAHPEDQALIDLIAEFTGRDEEFARLWAEGDVKANSRGEKLMRHPEAGDISLLFEVLMPLQDPDQLLVIYRPADDDSRSALDRLFAR
ncbi:helix-turn-helix transcriptional regulator [Streptomyces sp. NE06-03E]|uniref:XRE family transcriptional regulator n=1 Tax=Streptomyces sp. gb1(2016) TaxID=1828321 RepID=A0A652KUN2_9ACTN|nr:MULTISPECIES: helix-turn-helix transcriptional regulator [unclassified Streptomyces]WSS78392.1 helix-turn-helix transcriptional regulator [Streptomyces sp. NBC_01174]MDX3054785.1 helix-turn-helix transcriptional regulator [Streptomyces sp. NE06-03E]MDX3431145.1 helix-turn-helix transcriptional regulator [Streptomyces sp. ME01-18a]MDX3683159.1 helix-turn-helix transcriptional regulator [Streptomyces sp. AK04-4c]TXS27553.1 XRE family transcriptional regulator [Streptomyces sp. gb1(2016)]